MSAWVSGPADQLFIMLVLVGLLCMVIPYVFFSHSLQKSLKRVPKEKRILPASLSWFLLVPLAGVALLWILMFFGIGLRKIDESPYRFLFLIFPIANIVFTWLVIAINVPRSFARVVEGNNRGVRQAKTLLWLGMLYAILWTISIVPAVLGFALIPLFVIWVVYWVLVVDFRKKFLDSSRKTDGE